MPDDLRTAVEIMDRLRSPGGCPWDAAQTHRSLAPYLLEEAYETLEAIEADDPVHLREELGDLLLQVLFHARLAEERVEHRFTIDDVAADLSAKLIRRHPHVFADTVVSGAGEVVANWDEIKKAEKGRTSILDGVPPAQPALSLAAKLVSRAERADLDVAGPTGDAIGPRLFAIVAEAVAAGQDPEQELRETVRQYIEAVRVTEAERRR